MGVQRGRQNCVDRAPRKRIGYTFGLDGNSVLLGRISHLAEDAAMRRIDGYAEKVRRCSESAKPTARKSSAGSLPGSRPDLQSTANQVPPADPHRPDIA